MQSGSGVKRNRGLVLVNNKYLILCCILLCSCSLCSAGSISFTDPLNSYEYTVYDSDGDLVGTYNTSDPTFLLDSSGDYQIFVKPNTVSVISDPTVMFDWFPSYIPLTIGMLVILVFCGALYALFRRGV